ncbi:MAG: IPT/TIG domain-containing protein [Actinomycetia bacterium]|nr:IPT/TIG domain-containing protein [Actinomycetes bacterium]
MVDVIIVTEDGTSPNTPADDYSYGKPVIDEITPAVGDPKGGYEIVITGTGFTPDVKVYWDGDALDSDEFTVDNPTRITVTVPKGEDGDSVDVMVENDEGESNEEEFEYNGDMPYVTSISPTAGDADGGDTVYITGLNFPTDKNDLTVYFGTQEVDEDITALTATKITVKAPAPLEASDDVTEVVDVSVETDEGTSPNTPADDYSYGRARIESIEPDTGDTDGGTVVTITGTGFVKGITVYFGSTTVDAGNVTLISPTEIRVIAPPGEDGDEVLVKVKNAEGTSKDSDSDDEFTYDEDYEAPVVEEVSPEEGVAAGGTEVTITGSNFTLAAQVYFGTNEAEDVTYVSSTELKAVSPASTEGRRVHVQVKVGGQSSDTDYDTDAFTYYEDGDPTVESLNGEDVAYGPRKGGNTLTVIGSGFSSKPDVKIGSKTAADENVTVLSRTKLEVIVPSITTADTVDISIENTEDELVLENAYVYFTIDVKYFDPSASTWKDMTGDAFGAGTKVDIRMLVLDGDGQKIASTNLSESFPLLYYYRSTSDKGKENPSSGTTDPEGYLYWNDFGNFTGKTYTVYVGFDVNNTADTTSSSVFTSVDTYESASWEWEED